MNGGRLLLRPLVNSDNLEIFIKNMNIIRVQNEKK